MLRFNFLTLLWFIFFNIKSDIPIVFIHINDAFYLKDTLTQAKKFNKRVILISDKINSKYKDLGVEYYNISDFDSYAKYFQSTYCHLTYLPYDHILNCFKRWFILEEFARKTKLNNFFHCESDVLLYCNIDSEFNYFKKFDTSLIFTGFSAGSTSFWSYIAIKSLCEYILKFYENKPLVKKLLQQFNNGTIAHHYHDDIPFITYFVNSNPYKLKIGNICDFIEDSTFDSFIWYHFYYNSKDLKTYEYEMMPTKMGVMKKIVWKDNLPYCYNKDLKKLIRFKTLHFQGQYKKLISEYKIT